MEQYPGSYYQPLFDFMLDQFGISLLTSESEEIISIVNRLAATQPPSASSVEEDASYLMFENLARNWWRECYGKEFPYKFSEWAWNKLKAASTTQGAVWVGSQKRLPEITRQPKLFIVKWFDDRMYVRTMTAGQITDLAKNSVLEYFWLDETAPQRQAGPVWVKASDVNIQHNITYYAKWENETSIIKGTGWFQSDGTFFWNEKGYVPISEKEHHLLLILDESTPSKESDAVEFGIWIHKEGWVQSSDNLVTDNWWYKEDNDETYLTTSQLYHLFKQSK